LGSLRITEEDALERMTEYTDKMSKAVTSAIAQNKQAVMPKSTVLDPEWFNRNETKFENWWREI